MGNIIQKWVVINKYNSHCKILCKNSNLHYFHSSSCSNKVCNSLLNLSGAKKPAEILCHSVCSLLFYLLLCHFLYGKWGFLFDCEYYIAAGEDLEAGKKELLKMRVAVVGAGVSGLGSAYVLAKGGAAVVVYEKEDYVGGHAKTVTVDDGVDLDLGFMVFNRVRYE